MLPKKKKTGWWKGDPANKDKWVEELVNKSTKAVKGYEKYLLDKLTYNELAKIMQDLRSVLHMSNEEKKKD